MTFLMDFGIKSVVALSTAFLLAAILRRGSASIRYALWTCALAAVLMLPVAMRIAPGWSVAARHRTLPASLEKPDPRIAAISIEVLAGRPVSRELPMTIWITGMVILLARVGIGHWRVRTLFRSAATVREYGRKLVVKRSSATDAPLSFGLWHATVVLPLESSQWTEERWRIVLAHEMIHARRLDSWWGLLAQCAAAVNWFNPLAWLAVRQFRREQERSCDDAVIGSGIATAVYASHLVELARSIAIPEAALSMAGSGAGSGDLEGRVRALLDPVRPRRMASRPLCAAMVAMAVVVIVPLAAIRGQSVSKAAPVEAMPAAQPVEPRRQIAVSKPARPLRPSAPVPAAAVISVSGSIFDPSGAVVPDAKVLLKNTVTTKEEMAVTSASGFYQFADIPAGEYSLKVLSAGFAVYQKTVVVGEATTVNVPLSIGEGNEAVFITAKRPEGAVATGPQRIRVGGNVQAFNLIRKVTPMYPPDARAEGIEGTVLLRAIVSKTGTLLSIVPVNGSVDGRLVSTAVAAVSQWLYHPTLLNGEPVEVITTITVSFRLTDQ